MIKSVTVTNYVGDQLKLDLFRPELSGFAITSIDGLGPGKADINSTEMSTTDGARYNSARVSSRNIVMSLRYLYKDTIEDARQLSYKYFPLKKKVTLLFETDNRTLWIEGYVESNEPNIFSKESDTDISIICPYPFFYSGNGNQTTIFSGIEPMFEFPFSNESLEEPLIVMSTIQNLTENIVTYNGDVEIGLTINIHAIGEASNISIYNLMNGEVMRINTDKIATLTGEGISNGDDIIITTSKGEKSVKLIRDGRTINILNCMDKNTDWFTLVKGDNIFSFTADTGSNNLQFRIENKVVFEGV